MTNNRRIRHLNVIVEMPKTIDEIPTKLETVLTQDNLESLVKPKDQDYDTNKLAEDVPDVHCKLIEKQNKWLLQIKYRTYIHISVDKQKLFNLIKQALGINTLAIRLDFTTGWIAQQS